jgi:hypothetical protein
MAIDKPEEVAKSIVVFYDEEYNKGKAERSVTE